MHFIKRHQGKIKGGTKKPKASLTHYSSKTGGISASAKEDNRGEESKIPTPQGRKRTASKDLETKVSKRGKKPSPGGPATEGILTAQCPQGDQPSTEL